MTVYETMSLMISFATLVAMLIFGIVKITKK